MADDDTPPIGDAPAARPDAAGPAHPQLKPPPAPKKPGSPFKTFLIVLLTLALFVSLLGNFGMAAMLAGLDAAGGMDLELGDGTWVGPGEKPTGGDGPAPAVAVVTLSGIVMGPAGDARRNMQDWAEKALKKAADTDSIKGVVLEIDSPGGTVYASERIHTMVAELAADKPVHVLMGSTCASGGYYIASAAGRILANRVTVTGSIGVIASVPKVGDFLREHGLHMQTYTSGPNKDLLSPFKDDTPEQAAIIQELIDTMYERFVEVVAEGRGMHPDAVRPIADGRIYTAGQALEAGLIDGLAEDAEEAVDGLRKELGLDGVRMVQLKPKRSIFEELLGVKTPSTPLEQVLGKVAPPRGGFWYLWQGGGW